MTLASFVWYLHSVLDKAAARLKENPTSDAKILLVDDNPHGLSARRVILEELGYQLTTKNDPLDALDAFLNSEFDLVITDFKMPHLTGVELIAKIRETSTTIPIILISGFVDTLGLTEENTGSNFVIQKSANEVQQLVRAVARLLRKTPKKPNSTVGRPSVRKAKS